MSELRIQFGKRLRYLRRNKDITQGQLAGLAGVTLEFISNIERGRVSPSFETLQKLAAALDVKVEELFHFPEEGL